MVYVTGERRGTIEIEIPAEEAPVTTAAGQDMSRQRRDSADAVDSSVLSGSPPPAGELRSRIVKEMGHSY
jgi:hypothetical protein